MYIVHYFETMFFIEFGKLNNRISNIYSICNYDIFLYNIFKYNIFIHFLNSITYPRMKIKLLYVDFMSSIAKVYTSINGV